MKFMQNDCRKHIKRLSDSFIILPRPSTDFANTKKRFTIAAYGMYRRCHQIFFRAGSKMNFITSYLITENSSSKFKLPPVR